MRDFLGGKQSWNLYVTIDQSMGANCCVASRNKLSPVRNNCDVTNYRTVRLSPNWSFRWDNRTHIEDIMDNPSQFSNQHSGNVSSEIKSLADTENECISEGGSPFNVHTPRWKKKAGIAGSSKSLFADHSPRSNFSSEDKYSFKSKPSMSIPSPSSSSSSFKAPDPSSSKKARKHPEPEPEPEPEPDNETWSLRTFSELIKESTSNLKSSPQTCKICSKLMKEKSPWSTQKIVSTNELAVAAVLECGHVYHDECLENVTCDVNRYDPPCPVCTNGSRVGLKIMKTKGRFGRRGIVEASLVKKPFLKRHFSVGSRVNLEGEGMRKRKGKGVFWGRYNNSKN